MTRPRLVLALCLVLLGCGAAAASAAAADRVSIERVSLSLPAIDVGRLEALGFDVTDDVTSDHADVVAYSDAQRARLRALGYPVATRVADVLAATRTAARSRATLRAGSTRSALPSGRDAYRHLDDYTHDMDALVAAHPGLARRITLSHHSVQGREITGVELASNVGATDDGRPVYLVLGLHHAREWASGEVAMEFALDLAGGYGHDPRITRILDHERVIVVPVVNPDGFAISREATDAGNAMRRKNCAATVATPCETTPSRGVDLNRNYAAYWGGNGASPDRTDDTYRGPAPWSEPETQAIHELAQGLQVTGLQTLHNYAALVLRPPGFQALGLAPDEARLKELGDAEAAAAGYTSQYGYQLYEVTGATEDWDYVAAGTFGYTIELGGSSFQDPYQQGVVDQYLGTPGTPTEGKGVREALLLAAEEAMDARDHAILTGEARPGMVLRVRKSFQTTTSPVCQSFNAITSTCTLSGPPILLDDGLNTTMTVPASGRFRWHVNPSTRPFVAKAGGTEAWTFDCETPAGQVVASQAVVAARGQTVVVAHPCGTSAAYAAPGKPVLRVSLARAARGAAGALPRAGRRVRARCDVACTVQVRVRLGSVTVATGSRTVHAGRVSVVAVHATAAGRARLARARHGRLTVRVTARGAAGAGKAVTVHARF